MLNAGVEPAIVCSFVVFFFFINTSFCREIIIRTKQMPYHLANSAMKQSVFGACAFSFLSSFNSLGFSV